MKAGPVAINGVSIHPCFLGVTRARKYVASDGRWVLATRRGTVIATFATEAELQSWWQAFQTSQGRVPKALAEGMPTGSKGGGKGSTSPCPPGYFSGSSLRDWDFD
jgi:hypothetical protein